MSLESMLGLDNMHNLICRIAFARKNPFQDMPEFWEGKEYYVSRNNKGVCISDHKGNVLFGGVKSSIKLFKTKDNKIYIWTADADRKSATIYDEDGSVAFGGKHNWCKTQDEVLGKTYVIADESEDKQGVYRADGTLAFGGIHKKVFLVMEGNGVAYLIATDKDDGSWNIFMEDGSIPNTYGGPKQTALSFKKIEGRDYLWVQKDSINNSYLFSEDGTSYHHSLGILLKFLDNPYFFKMRSELFSAFERMYKLIDFNDQTEFVDGLKSTLEDIIYSNKSDPVQLEGSLKQMIICMDYLCTHPEEAMNYSLGGVAR